MLDDATTIIREDSTEDKAEMLYSYQETWKKKIAAIKTLEEEIIDLKNDTAIIEAFINEGRRLEITTKAKLNSINSFYLRHFQGKLK